MAQIYSIDGVIPVVHPEAFVHPTAVLIGDVIIGPGCYVGPCASLRGDFGRLILERGSNIQDGCVMHGFPNTDTVIEEDGHIGHGAILHGCRIGRDALVGMNAVVMDGAIIGESAMVAAMAFVRAGFEVPPRSLAAGIPGQDPAPADRSRSRLETRRNGRLSAPGVAQPAQPEGGRTPQRNRGKPAAGRWRQRHTPISAEDELTGISPFL